MFDFSSLDPALTILAGVLLSLVLLVLYVIHTRKIAALTAQIDQRAREQYEQWQQRDYKSLVAQQSSVAHRESQAELNLFRCQSNILSLQASPQNMAYHYFEVRRERREY